MNSLEFINQEIELCKKNLKNWQRRVELTHLIEPLQEKIKFLQQIKTELEAWEVVKDKITTIGYYDTQEDFEEDINEHKALCLVSNLKFQNSNDEDEWFIPLNEKEAITLKKALEVKE